MELHNYSVKPVARFFGEDKYHLGIELEVEAPNPDARKEGLNLMRRPSFMYAKKDGSLSDALGVEFVTHPISKDLWMSKGKINAASRFFAFTKKLREMGFSSHGNGRCGLHIHVSLQAFAPCVMNFPDKFRTISLYDEGSNFREKYKKCTHLYWFCRLVNSDLFAKLSQRKEEELHQWCRLCNVTTRDFHRLGSEGRHVSTNITRRTVEVRTFRGNLREDRIRKALESVIAAVEFTRGLTSKDYVAIEKEQTKIFDMFLTYVFENKSTYQNLQTYLEEIGAV